MSRLPQHNSFFDPYVVEAREFATTQLGLKVSEASQVSVIDERDADEVRSKLIPGSVGGINHKTGEILLIPEPNLQNPDGASARLGSQLVHEFTHSATANLSQHTFFNEALAGMGEAKYLEWLEAQSRWKPMTDFVLERAGVRVWVPAAHRYFLPSSDAKNPANSSQGLLAASAVGLGMHMSGDTVADVMLGAKPGGVLQFERMKSAIDTLKPGLAYEVESFPNSTDGIIQATAVIQEVAQKQGIKDFRLG